MDAINNSVCGEGDGPLEGRTSHPTEGRRGSSATRRRDSHAYLQHSVSRPAPILAPTPETRIGTAPLEQRRVAFPRSRGRGGPLACEPGCRRCAGGSGGEPAPAPLPSLLSLFLLLFSYRKRRNGAEAQLTGAISFSLQL